MSFDTPARKSPTAPMVLKMVFVVLTSKDEDTPHDFSIEMKIHTLQMRGPKPKNGHFGVVTLAQPTAFLVT